MVSTVSLFLNSLHQHGHRQEYSKLIHNCLLGQYLICVTKHITSLWFSTSGYTMDAPVRVNGQIPLFHRQMEKRGRQVQHRSQNTPTLWCGPYHLRSYSDKFVCVLWAIIFIITFNVVLTLLISLKRRLVSFALVLISGSLDFDLVKSADFWSLNCTLRKNHIYNNWAKQR